MCLSLTMRESARRRLVLRSDRPWYSVVDCVIPCRPRLHKHIERPRSVLTDGMSGASAPLSKKTSATTRALFRAPTGLGAQEMKQKDLRTLIVREWDSWLQSQSISPGSATGRDSLKFYFDLQDRRSSLLNFQSRGRDKWQIVHAWLLSEHRVLD